MSDTHFVKFQGKVNIPQPLEIDKVYKVEAQVGITDVRKSSNENGEYDVTYVAKPFQVEILKETGERVKASDPRHNSQKIRNMLWKHYFEEGYTEDFQAVYDQATWVILSMMPGILREAIKRLNTK